MKFDRERVMRAREMLGYGIETTAEKAGISKNSVLRAEHEEDIRPVTARKIAAALEVEVRDLLPLVEAPLPDFEDTRALEALDELLLDFDAGDLEVWVSRVGSVPELKRAAQSLWSLYGQLAGTIGRAAEDAERLSEVGRKLDIISNRIKELAPTPLATITEREGFPVLITYHEEPTPEVRARLREEYPGAEEVEARETALVY